jgi:hypothetical protein
MEMQYCSHANISHQPLCGSEALSPIASIILQIPPTSASSERNWSLFGNTYTKACSRLTNTRVEKLVTICANVRLFDAQQQAILN